MSKLATIIEQTTFLIESQEKARKKSTQQFKDILSFVEATINEYKAQEGGIDSENFKSLEKIYDMLAGRAQEMQDITDQDIEFLKEQREAFDEIEKIDDAAQRAELMKALFEDDEEILETGSFKKSVIEEAEEGDRYLAAMVDDIKASVQEGDIKGVELLLEAAIEESKKLEQKQEKEAAQGGCCSGGCPPEGCGSCSLAADGNGDDEDFDLMSIVDQYSKDLEEDLAKKDEQKK